MNAFLTALYYTHESLPLFLRHEKARSLAGDLLVELSPVPALAYHLGLETPRGFPGLAGLLSGLSLKELERRSEHLPTPVVLAGGDRISPAVLIEALRRLRRHPDAPHRVTLLIPTTFVPELGAGLNLIDRHALAWDIAPAPGRDVLPALEILIGDGLLGPDTFAGIFPYASEEFDDADHGPRVSALLSAALPGALAHPLLELPPAA